MFGLEFLFSAALWALPLAALPIVLHLLFRRKSPVVPFSTLRFIKSSIQRTAARKKIQRWLLLGCRALLLLLLIWAVAQPAKMLASGWFGGGNSPVAAIVVDTSYSMSLDDQGQLIDRASIMIEDLLRDQMKNARVAIYRSQSKPDRPEQLLSASEVLAQWTPLQREANPKPIVERISSATAMLNEQSSDQKWLIVIGDFQGKEFPRPLPDFAGRILLLDLHPKDARSMGITNVKLDPPQPIAGVGAEAVVEVVGRGGESRAVTLRVTTANDQTLSESPAQVVHLDDSGKATLRFPIKLSTERWQKLTAKLGGEDAMVWDDSRSFLIEVPPKQAVTLIDSKASLSAQRFVKLSLDPGEGQIAQWPIAVTSAAQMTGKENVVVWQLNDWPAESQADRLREFARAGGTVVLMLKPGLEEAWNGLPDAQKNAILRILPSAPLPPSTAGGTYRASAGQADDPIMAGLTGEQVQLNSIAVRSFVPLSYSNESVTLLNGHPAEPGPGAKSIGLLYRKPVGTGQVYCWTTLPDSRFTNLATHPVFLPLMVRMSLRSPGQTLAGNVALGEPIVVSGPAVSTIDTLQINSPDGGTFEVKAKDDRDGRRFEFNGANTPGLYTWRRTAGDDVLGLSNVEPAGSESSLTYRDATQLAGDAPHIVVAHSLDELNAKLKAVSEPEPRWTTPIAIVLLLMCFEALMGSASQLWKPISLKGVLETAKAS